MQCSLYDQPRKRSALLKRGKPGLQSAEKPLEGEIEALEHALRLVRINEALPSGDARADQGSVQAAAQADDRDAGPSIEDGRSGLGGAGLHDAVPEAEDLGDPVSAR
mgnify:FL=1